MVTRLLPVVTAALVLLSQAPIHGGDKSGKSDARIRYDFSDTMQIGFVLLDDNGKAKNITFDPQGGTNVTVIRIDGRDYAFGFEGGVFIKKKVQLKNQRGHQTSWKVDAIEVTQTVEIVASKTLKLDTCIVTYKVVNKDTKPHKIGIRPMIDTMINMTDGHAFASPDLKEIITTKADYLGDKVPAVVLAIERPDAKNPGLTAVFTLKLGQLESPSRFSITTWPKRDDAFGWEIPVENIGKDAAVAIYWNPVMLAAGTSREVGYAYGGGAVETVPLPK
jgi:hypothetical protein